MLQVLDEVDDAIGALRLWALGVLTECGLVIAGALGFCAIAAALAAGAELPLMCCAATMLGVAAVVKFNETKPAADP